MGGFVNDNNNYEIVFCDNVNFSGDGTPTGKITTNGQLLIGAATAPFIRPGLLTSAGGTISWTFGAGTISGDVNGAKVGQTVSGDSGGALSPTAGNWTFSGGTTGLTFSGATSTETLTGTLVLANGGLSASLTASNGGIFYSTASAGAILAGTATAHQLLLSGASSAPLWSTTTYPTTNAINTLLYASAANVMSALATGNNGVLITSSSGVPSYLAAGTTGQVLTATTGSPASWASPASSMMTWVTNPGNITVSNNTGYFISVTTTLTLPASPSDGFTVSFAEYGASNITILANGHNIQIGPNQGSTSATDNGVCSLTLVYSASAFHWIATSIIGLWPLN
jgi:hypothetical protein